MGGRKAKPISLHIAEGNKNRLTKAEIEARQEAESNLQPKKDKIKPPSWLGIVARKEWKRIYKELEDLNLLTNIDITALAIYCDAYEKYQEAVEGINDNGLVVEHTNAAGNTNIVQSPYVQIANKYADIIKKFCAEFGLTPSARCKLTLPKEEKEVDPFEQQFG